MLRKALTLTFPPVKRTLITALLLLFAFAANAQLTFEKTEASLSMTASQDSTTVVFPFENKSGEEIKIVEVRPTCSCITASADKTAYPPGAKGEVRAVLKVGSATGTIRKSINVSTTTGETKHPTQKLQLSAEVPEVIKITPTMLEWDIGEDPKPKKLTFEVGFDETIRIRTVKSSRDNFDVEVIPIEEGKKYELQLTPTDTSAPMLGVLNIETDSQVAKLRKKLAFFSIKRARPQRATPTP